MHNILVEKNIVFAVITLFIPFVSIAIALIPLLYYDWRIQKIRSSFIEKLTRKEIKIVNNINDI